ncbi:MAG: NAD(P)/FAD-dependent oxidoreductase [Acidimicrobiales bacterium]
MSPEVVIVGAGVVGTSIAFHLASSGAPDVLVVERSHVASGMSSRSSALVRMHYSFGPEVSLAVRSDEIFESWPDLVGCPKVVKRPGFVRIVLPGEEPQLRANIAMQRALGADSRLVERDELTEIAPGLQLEDVACAGFEPRGGYGDGATVAGDFLAAARASGASYRAGCVVTSLLVEGDRVIGIRTTGGDVHAGTIVVATGIWAKPLLGSAGVDVPIEGELHHVAVARHRPQRGATLACIDSTTQSYFRPEGSGETTLVGSFGGRRPAGPDDSEAAPDLDELAANLEAASRRLPGLCEAGIAGGVTGVYDMTPDARPLLGSVPGLDGLMMAVGFSGMGFKISPAVGEAVAGLLLGDDKAAAGLRAFRPSRFDEGEAIAAPFAYSDD